MNIERTNSGLVITADVITRAGIKQLRKHSTSELQAEAQFIMEHLGGDPMGDGINYEQVPPEEVGALTDTPLISDGENIYGYMDYQIKNFLEELEAGEATFWKKG